MNLADSDQQIHDQLIDALYAMPAPQRMTARWVMNDDWARRIDAIRLAGIAPVPSWAHRPDKELLGRPVQVTDDGGEPHMEARPGRDGTVVEWGQDVAYRKCCDPHCPARKPGSHHAHRVRDDGTSHVSALKTFSRRAYDHGYNDGARDRGVLPCEHIVAEHDDLVGFVVHAGWCNDGSAELSLGHEPCGWFLGDTEIPAMERGAVLGTPFEGSAPLVLLVDAALRHNRACG